MVSKTWSREVATALMVFTAYLAYDKGPEEAALFMWPVVTFAIPAFGLKQDSVKKFLEGRDRSV